jgi:hypothetical protein
MTFLFKFVWGTKVCLMGWSAYRACAAEDSQPFICALSVSYFAVLALATLCSWKGLPTPKQIDGMEADYLRRLEEGMTRDNEKSS